MYKQNGIPCIIMLNLRFFVLSLNVFLKKTYYITTCTTKEVLENIMRIVFTFHSTYGDVL